MFIKFKKTFNRIYKRKKAMNTLNPQEINDRHQTKYSIGIRGRIFLGFTTIAIILMITTFFITKKIDTAANFANTVVTSSLPSVDTYTDINGQVYESKAALYSYLVTRNPKFMEDYKDSWIIISDSISKLDPLAKNWNNKDLLNDWNEIKILLNDLKSTEDADLTRMNSSDPKVLATIINEIQPKVNHAMDLLDGPRQPDGTRSGGMYDKLYETWKDSAQTTVNDMTEVKNIEYILLIFYIFASFIIAVITAESILKPLNNAITIAKKIANGERNVEITVTTHDETGALLNALDIMLRAIIENEIKLQESEKDSRKLFENIVKTANTFSQHSSKVAKGDLTERISIDNNNEMSQLGTDLNTMTESLATVTHRITEACHNMVSTLEEVKQSVDVQSTGASEQASSINEITTSLEEIEKSSTQTIEKAKALGEAAERTREKGQLGLDAVEQSVQGMKSVREKVQTIAQTILDLSNQTQQVGEITNVVNTLAQQSKMLALNASIEAAKAGEAGKGFAVVAAEVKNLAEQSEQSTAQVQKILEDIRHATEKAVMATEEGTKGVDMGTEMVEQTGEVVRNLTDVIHETTIASEQIAAAIRQEGVGIEQITAGMNEINQVTSSFVASVKQTTEALDDLALIARHLKEYVDIYKI